MVASAGIEPATLGLEVPCSIQLSYEATKTKLPIYYIKLFINFKKFLFSCASGN